MNQAGARLAGHRPGKVLEGVAGGAALHNAPKHGGDLVGRIRVDDLLAILDDLRLGLVFPLLRLAVRTLALVMAVDGASVAVLNAVDHRRLDLLAAVGEHGVGGGQAQQSRLTGAQRHGENAGEPPVDAHALGQRGELLDSHVLSQSHRHDVARLLDAAPQRRRTVELLGVVLGLPDPVCGSMTTMAPCTSGTCMRS